VDMVYSVAGDNLRLLRSPSPSIDVYLLEEQFCLISSFSIQFETTELFEQVMP